MDGAEVINGAEDAGVHLVPTVSVDELLDDHATEFAECRRWAEGQGRPESGGGALRRAETACLEGRGYSVQ